MTNTEEELKKALEAKNKAKQLLNNGKPESRDNHNKMRKKKKEKRRKKRKKKKPKTHRKAAQEGQT